MTFDEFKAILVEFDDADVAEFNRAYPLALPGCNSSRMAGDYNEALANNIAHRITMERRRRQNASGSSPGDRVSVSEETAAGRASETRSGEAVQMQMRSWWYRSQYGQRYREILAIAGGGGLAV